MPLAWQLEIKPINTYAAFGIILNQYDFVFTMFRYLQINTHAAWLKLDVTAGIFCSTLKGIRDSPEIVHWSRHFNGEHKNKN